MPYLWLHNKVAVEADELVPRFWNVLKSLQSEISRYRNKPYGIKKLQSGGNGRKLLIDFDTLSAEIQEELGDPRKAGHLLEKYYQTQDMTIRYYAEWKRGEKHLTDEEQRQYVINATTWQSLLQLEADILNVRNEKIQEITRSIDNLTRLVASNDADLDTVQEIVNVIKTNSQLLKKLQISNIIGLTQALADKADKTHNHDEKYHLKSEIEDLLKTKAGLDHKHDERYSQLNHTHSYNDLTDKPTIPNLSDYVSKTQIAPLINNLGSDSLNGAGDIKNSLGKYAFHVTDNNNFSIFSGEIGAGDLLALFSKMKVQIPKTLEIPQLHIHRSNIAQVFITPQAGKQGYYLDFKDNPQGNYSNLRAGSFEVMRAGTDSGFRFKDDMFGGSGDKATMYLNQREGESFSLVIEVQNDYDDFIEINTPSYDGLKHNGHKIFDAGNISVRADVNQINLNATFIGMNILCTSNNPITIEMSGFPDLATCSIIKAGNGNITFSGKTIVGEREINGNRGSSASIIINGGEAIINVSNK